MKRKLITAILMLSLATVPASADFEIADGDDHFAKYPLSHFTEYHWSKVAEESDPIEEAEEEECCCGCSIPCDDLGQFEVTYYCDYGTTKTGATTHIGTAGVDPSVIPLGSRFLIEYEDGTVRECVAEDTGSAVIGNVIDVWLESESECWANGRDIARVYLVREE